MASFNKVILIGNMTSDPETKQTTSGVAVCSFTIAVNRKFTKSDNEQSVDFINVVAWRNQAEFVGRYFKKGKPILVCGQLQTRSWTDKDGNKRTTTEVVADEISFIGGENSSQGSEKPVQSYPNPAAYGNALPSQDFEEVSDDEGDLPF